jgi:hypothetical protein
MRTLLFLTFLIANFTSSVNLYSDEYLDNYAEEYVKLVLATGKYDKDYVDSYFGPEKFKTEVDSINLSLEQISEYVGYFTTKLLKLCYLYSNSNKHSDSDKVIRCQHLLRMFESLDAKVEILQGRKMTFDEECYALYDATAPSYPEEKYEKTLNELESIIPGQGDLALRFLDYRKQFIIPDDKIDTVFKRAIEEGRKRTLKYIQLPDNEQFILEYVRGKSWGGYNWFKGDATSLIQINLDVPIYIDRAVGLACHEGYPGHHVYHSLIAENFVNRNNWLEFSIYPLFSPEALISEGTANYGIEVAFPNDEKLKFEKEVIFPLAGLDTSKVEEYYKILKMLSQLDYATVDIARWYLDGKIDRENAVKKIMKYKLRSKEHAETNIKFIEQYRSYIINYYIGEELCRNWVESRLSDKNDNEQRWKLFLELMSKPILPSELEK